MISHPITNNTSNSVNRIFWIEGFRGVASLAIVLWHTSNYVMPYGEGPFLRLLWPSSIFALDLFFILSGFVMVVSTNGKTGPSESAIFLAKRLVRLFPLYALATIVYVWIFPPAAPTPEAVLRSLLFLPGMVNAAAPVYGFPVISVGWSLNYEVYFYAVFALSMLFGKHQWAALVAWSVMVLIVPTIFATSDAPFMSAEQHYVFRSTVLNLVTNPILALFGAGMLLGVLHRKGVKLGDARISCAARIIAFALVGVQYSVLFRVEHGLLGSGLTLIPLVLIFTVTRPCVFPGIRWFIYLGAISYALYVVHPVVILGARHPEHQGMSGVSSMLTITISSIILAAVVHRTVERPIASAFRRLVKYFRNWPNARRPKPAGH